jgi:hypothetical protein
MHNVDMTPGLSAWDRRRYLRRKQWANRAVLLTGLVGASLYALPHDANPLVSAGILVLPVAPRDVAIPDVMLAIPLHPSDLPKHRPSLADARSADQIEEAHVIGVVSSVVLETLPNASTERPDTSSDVSQSGSSEPMYASIGALSDQPSTSALAAPRKTVAPQAQTQAKPASATNEPDEDLAAARKRAFTVDR